MTRLTRKVANLLKRTPDLESNDSGVGGARSSGPAVCDTCAFVDFFRSNGDGQISRLQAFCRCPDGPFLDRPAPPERHCSHWRRNASPPEKPQVGDPTLSV
jgi:hypothetical protein